jgi:predicted metal-binding membrane protein
MGADVAARRAQVARVARWRPEWRFGALVLLAWAALAAGLATMPAGHGGHAGAGPVAAVLGALPGWVLMAVAMMLPGTLPAVRHVGLNSLRARRQRAMGVYTVVYVAVWAAFGVLALGLAQLLVGALEVDQRSLIVLVLGAAAAWQLTRGKRRALLSCRRTVPLPPLGRRADAGCARFALQQSSRCVRSCWALMAVMAVVGHASVLWMAVLTALAASEELTELGRRSLRHSAGALAVVAAVVALGAPIPSAARAVESPRHADSRHAIAAGWTVTVCPLRSRLPDPR